VLRELDAQWTQGDWLNFKDEGPVSTGSVTHKFSVWDRKSGIMIGYVKWHVPWRQYTFYGLNFPLAVKMFVELAEFLSQQTQKVKNK
jgi:hypothetical protein